MRDARARSERDVVVAAAAEVVAAATEVAAAAEVAATAAEVTAAAAATATVAAAAFTALAAAEQQDLVRVDVGRVPLAAVLVFPLAVLDAPFDADRPALGEDLVQRFGALPPDHDVVPLGPRLTLAGLGHVGLGRREPEAE